jgi:hypothetical protein
VPDPKGATEQVDEPFPLNVKSPDAKPLTLSEKSSEYVNAEFFVIVEFGAKEVTVGPFG